MQDPALLRGDDVPTISGLERAFAIRRTLPRKEHRSELAMGLVRAEARRLVVVRRERHGRRCADGLRPVLRGCHVLEGRFTFHRADGPGAIIQPDERSVGWTLGMPRVQSVSCIIGAMETAATVFLTLGILLVGFGLLSLANILNLGITQHQQRHADITTPKFWLGMVKVMLIGVALIAIGGVFVFLV